MKILFKSFIAVFIVLTGLSTNAASITAWSISSPLSGNCVSVNTTGKTSITFSVTCSRATLFETVNAKFHLQAYAPNGANKVMHSDVSIVTADFFNGGAYRVIEKTFTVQVDLTGTYYPSETNIHLVSTQGLTSVPSNNYPIVVPIYNNYICCGANFTNTSTAYTLTGSIPKGGNNTYTYQWQSTIDSTNWADITFNGTNINYTTPILTQTTFYRRIVRSNSTPAVTQNISNRIGVYVHPARIAGVHDEAVMGGSQISAYPNPFSSSFSVVSGAEIKSVEVINMHGAVVYTRKDVYQNTITVDTDSFPAGVFFLKISTSDNQEIMKKIIKN